MGNIRQILIIFTLSLLFLHGGRLKWQLWVDVWSSFVTNLFNCILGGWIIDTITWIHQPTCTFFHGCVYLHAAVDFFSDVIKCNRVEMHYEGMVTCVWFSPMLILVEKKLFQHKSKNFFSATSNDESWQRLINKENLVSFPKSLTIFLEGPGEKTPPPSDWRKRILENGFLENHLVSSLVRWFIHLPFLFGFWATCQDSSCI